MSIRTFEATTPWSTITFLKTRLFLRLKQPRNKCLEYLKDALIVFVLLLISATTVLLPFLKTKSTNSRNS